ncbi:MAG: hypothetical protein NVS3B14_24020 [Ktedonobacteraceae bacterium]
MTLIHNVCKFVAAGGALLLFTIRSHPSNRERRGQRRSQLAEYGTQPDNTSIELPTSPNPS